MKQIGKFIARRKISIVILALLLLIPSALGFIATKINYDILSYLPDSLETVAGQDIMVDEFGMGAFSMVIVDGMEKKDVAALEEKIEAIDHVEEVLWYDDFVGIDVPVSMIPQAVADALFQGDSTLMIALFDDTTSSETTMEAIEEMRAEVGHQCFISGMSGIVTDIKNLAMKEIPGYVLVATLLSLLVLMLTTESFAVPFIFLASIGLAVVYNMGSNLFLGDVSYITEALVAVLQLGVTTDYSIFLLQSYEECKPHYENRDDAMAEAISKTFVSVMGSSLTTVAGFAALILMTFALGANLGIVMIKGVIIGVLCCVTVLPAMILLFEKSIDKLRHRSFFPDMSRPSNFIRKYHWVWILLFVVAFYPAYHGNNDVELYYNIDTGLPDDLDSAIANEKLKSTFDMSNVHILLMNSKNNAKDKARIIEEIEQVDGVDWALGIQSVLGGGIPESMIPDKLTSSLKSGNYEMVFICSQYSSATAPCNAQIAAINEIVKRYDDTAMVIGEAPLMKDLEDVTSVDLMTVNFLSVLAIFLIVMIVFKSVTLPFILVITIEFSIFVNMAFSYYRGVSQAFVAPIVVGTIQLGATVDYAILMTNRYKEERMAGKSKKEAIKIAHETSFHSIITSAFSLFASTIGVALYSNIDMIKSIVILLARGALISMVIVLLLLPSFFTVFDRLICYTTKGMRKCLRQQSIETGGGKDEK